MDAGSVVSEPISAHHRAFTKQKSASMTILNPKSCAAAAKYGHQQHDHVEAKMAGMETALSSSNSNIAQCATTGRRRKGTSLGGTLSSRSSRSEAKELRSALQDREAVIQNLRIQLCLGKLPRPTGPPLDESEKPAAEQKLSRLKSEAENKKIKIRNLKSALDKLDITDNIDIRIRQAELEYALGREELQMLSIVEEARALQARLEKSKPESQTLYSVITSGVALSLHAVQATTGRWAVQTKPDQPGIFVEWALEGDGLYKGDRILEVNGKIVTCKTKEELQKIVGNSGKCQMVVLRKKSAAIPQKQLDQEKENNMRLQHRISYLEEQVKELQSVKEQQQQLSHHQQQQQHAVASNGGTAGHVTSISISSPPSTPPEKPLIFQRGNYITTLVGGKPIELLGNNNNNGNNINNTNTNANNNNSHSQNSTTNNLNNVNSNNSYSNGSNSSNNNSNNNYSNNNYSNSLTKSHSAAHITKTLIKESAPNESHHSSNGHSHNHDHHRTPLSYMPSKSLSASRISINSDSAYLQPTYKRSEKERHRERYEKMAATAASKTSVLQQRAQMQARSVEHLNHYNGLERRRDTPRTADIHQKIRSSSSKLPSDMRSVKSLDFDSENEGGGGRPGISDTASEARSVRPTPPKKPLRLSLQRAQSLQTVELNPPTTVTAMAVAVATATAPDLDGRKRPSKRAHHPASEKSAEGLLLIENCSPLQTSSLGRQKQNM